MTDFKPLRSVLYMPSSNQRALEKAKSIPCDAIIFDLEDSVAPYDKETAREGAVAAVQSGEYGRRQLIIRVNSIETEWHDEDLAEAAKAGPDVVLVPKVDSAEDVRRLVAAMEAAGAPEHTKLWAMVETPIAMLNALSIAQASDRLTGFVMGTNDLVKELYAEHVPGRQSVITGLGLALLAARAAGIVIIDGVYNDIDNEQGFLAECEQGRQMGFDGKTLIHPRQVAGANYAFTPSEQAISDALGLIDAFSSSHKGVVTYKGRMVENLHVDSAKRTLAIAAAIEALQG